VAQRTAKGQQYEKVPEGMGAWAISGQSEYFRHGAEAKLVQVLRGAEMG